MGLHDILSVFPEVFTVNEGITLTGMIVVSVLAVPALLRNVFFRMLVGSLDTLKREWLAALEKEGINPVIKRKGLEMLEPTIRSTIEFVPVDASDESPVARVDIAIRHVQGCFPMRISNTPSRSMQRNLVTGDPNVDLRVPVWTDRAPGVLAALNAESRQALLSIGPVRVTKKTLHALGAFPSERPTRESIKSFQVVQALARRLAADPDEWPGRLAHNALFDPFPGVCAENLRMLQSEYPDYPITLDTSRTLLKDEDMVIRLIAAGFLGDEGIPAVEGALDQDWDTEVAQAVRRLADKATPAKLAPVLVRCLGKWHSRELQQAAAEVLFHLGPSSELDRLIELQAELELDQLPAVIKAMDFRWSVSYEPGLWVWVERYRDHAVAADIVRLLGKRGSASSVVPLMDVIRKAGLRRGNLKRAAREAIAKIQSRLGNAERGTISLAETAGPEGAVSLAPQGGEVSEAKEEGE